MTNAATSAAGAIFPILGAGIGIGILAHTARHVTNTMYSPRYHRRRQPYHRPYTKARHQVQSPYNPRTIRIRYPKSRPRYRWK